MTPISNPSSFHAEAARQMVCAVCGRGGPFEAHHVIEKQHLRRLGLGLPLRYDTRCALRLCTFEVNNCHARHTLAVRRVKVSELTAENIEYAVETLGDRAGLYLDRYYDMDVELACHQ